MKMSPHITSVFLVIAFAYTPSSAEVDHSVYISSKDCRSCHKETRPAHHMARPEKKVEFPLNSTGKMVCITCHDCVSGLCVLRRGPLELCRGCHDCAQGMACLLGAAHLGMSANIERQSFEDCAACHDGSVAKEAMGPKGHKVDVVYLAKKGFNRVKDRRVVFVSGKVKCISCHDPYKNESHRLVKSNEGSGLCLTCHRK